MNPFKAKSRKEAEAVEAAAPMTKLEERREELRERFTELQFDLGGAAYEMAARDYFRLDVLAKMAARLQLVDAELAEIERMARLEKAGASGSCPGCGSLHAQGAVYCWRCGRNLHETTQAVVSPLAAVPSALEPVESEVAHSNGSTFGMHGVVDDPIGSPAPPEATSQPGFGGEVTDPGYGAGLEEDLVDFDTGPRNHPNLDHGSEGGGDQRPDWPSA